MLLSFKTMLKTIQTKRNRAEKQLTNNSNELNTKADLQLLNDSPERTHNVQVAEIKRLTRPAKVSARRASRYHQNPRAKVNIQTINSSKWCITL